MRRDDEPSPIADQAGLIELVAHLRRSKRFAFDTEFVSESTFEPVLCLVQVATKERLAIVDPFEVDDLSPFWEAVLDPTVEVVTHACGEDLRIARLQAGRFPERIVDVQIAAGLIGLSYPLSLGNLARATLDVTLEGSETRTDWRRRPLSLAQLRYALDDVRFLLDIADHIQKRLEEWERAAWAEAEYRRFLDHLKFRDDEERWRRLPGLQQLNRRGLETAKRLSDWRAAEAKRTDRPIRQIMRDDLLVSIAKRRPTSKKELEALRDFNRPQLLGRSREILDEIAAASETPADRLPLPNGDRREDVPGGSMIVGLLSAALAWCCARQRIAGSLVASVNDLKELIHWRVNGRSDAQKPSLLRGWREDVCGRVLLDVLDGAKGLRVVDPEAEIPVRIVDFSDENL